MTSMTSFWCPYSSLWTYFTCSSVSFVDFEQVNICWAVYSRSLNQYGNILRDIFFSLSPAPPCFKAAWQKVFWICFINYYSDLFDQYRADFIGHTEKCLRKKCFLSLYLWLVLSMTWHVLELTHGNTIHSIRKRTRNSQKLGHEIKDDRRFKGKKKTKFKLINWNVWVKKREVALREKCPNTEFFLVRVFPHSD